MFERFTERAVNVVSESQRFAKEMGSPEVSPEHLLLALVSEAKGVSLKIFRMYGVEFSKVQTEIENLTREKKSLYDEARTVDNGKGELLKEKSLDLTFQIKLLHLQRSKRNHCNMDTPFVFGKVALISYPG